MHNDNKFGNKPSEVLEMKFTNYNWLFCSLENCLCKESAQGTICYTCQFANIKIEFEIFILSMSWKELIDYLYMLNGFLI